MGEVAAAAGVGDELVAGVLGEVEAAHQFGAGVHELVRGEAGALGHQAGDHTLHAGEVGAAQVVGGEVDAFHQGAGVDPLVAGVPAFHRGRVHQVHAHILGFLAEFVHTGLDFPPVVADHPQGAGHHFGGVLDLGVAGVLEAGGIEQGAEHLGDVVAAVEVGLFQGDEGFLVLGRGLAPAGYGDFVGDEEVVHMAGDEAGGGGVLADQIQDMLAVPVAGLAEEGFFRFVVVGGVVAELPGAAAVGEGRVGGRDVPAGEGAGAGFDIVLGVVETAVHADAHGEEFQELAAVVFVDGRLVALAVVQVIDHCRAGGEVHQQLAEVAHAVVPEHLDHPAHFLAGVDFGVAGAEDHMPEEGHLFPQLVLGVDHAVHPVLDVDFDGAGVVVGGVVAQHQVVLDAGGGSGVEQLVHHGVVAPDGGGFQLVPAGAEAGAAHQVRHQCDVVASCHWCLLVTWRGERAD